MGDTEIVGREEELQAISSFLEHRAAPGALLIEGDAGIGKTTLWLWGMERAAGRGWHVLTALPAASEARLAFAAIGDLLGGMVDAVLPRLPPPQKHALAVALLLEDARGRPPSERAIAIGVLGALRILAEERPLLVAVDDVQWLDRPSAGVPSFIGRRLDEDPVGLLLAQRTDEIGGIPLGLDRAFGERLRRVRPSPLSLGATHRLLRSRLGLTLPRPALRRVHTACGGNPLFAMEIGRVVRENPDVLRTNEPLPVPHDVEELVSQRITRLSEAGREAVLAAALLGEPTVAAVEGAAAKGGAGRGDGRRCSRRRRRPPLLCSPAIRRSGRLHHPREPAPPDAPEAGSAPPGAGGAGATPRVRNLRAFIRRRRNTRPRRRSRSPARSGRVRRSA